MGPGIGVAVVFWVAYMGVHLASLSVVTDWVSFAVDEGYTSNAARRILAGELPYIDFFFLWTPGTAFFHALLQKLGAGWQWERAASLIASAGSSVLVLRIASDFLSQRDRGFLICLLIIWGFGLWNFPYSSWYAVFWAVLAISAQGRAPFLAGLLFAMSFWFKQNIGILSLSGAVFWWFMPVFHGASPKLAAKPIIRLVAGFSTVFTIPFLLFYFVGGGNALWMAFRQIFLFPISYPSLMGTLPEGRIFAAPLTLLGLWLVSFPLLRGTASVSNKSSLRLLQFSLIMYALVQAGRNPKEFLTGSLILLAFIAWPFSFAMELYCSDRTALRRFLAVWLPGLGIFLQVLPRLDFQHFLFVLPLSLFMLIRGIGLLPIRYPFLQGLWVRAPVLLLLIGGLYFQLQLVKVSFDGIKDGLGFHSSGKVLALNEEAAAVIRFLRAEGLSSGGPLLVLPNATSFYQWSGFRNPTPHQQFFPGYVEAYGAEQSDVLAGYREKGGYFLLVQERSGLASSVPVIASEIERDYTALKMFPEYFTVYVPKGHSRSQKKHAN